jgi:hypothetical protein
MSKHIDPLTCDRDDALSLAARLVTGNYTTLAMRFPESASDLSYSAFRAWVTHAKWNDPKHATDPWREVLDAIRFTNRPLELLECLLDNFDTTIERNQVQKDTISEVVFRLVTHPLMVLTSTHARRVRSMFPDPFVDVALLSRGF